MSRQRALVVPLITVAIIIVAGVWWWNTYERVSETAYVGLSGAAKEDPFLALRLFLKQSDVRLEEPAVNAPPAAKFDALPPLGTLILSDRRHVLMTPARVASLVAWVEAGGHLIVEAEYPGRPDPLLTAFGLTRKALTHPGAAGATNENSKAPSNENQAPRSPLPSFPLPKRGPVQINVITEVQFPGAARPLKAEFSPYQSLGIESPNAYWTVADAAGVRIASAARGAGRVSALSNFDPLTYRGTFDLKTERTQPTHLGKYDHAELLLKLIRLHPRAAQAPLRLVWGNDELSLWTWLRSNAALALVSLGLLLLVWLWRVIPRFGPLQPDAAPAEQKLISHLEAAGRFYWKHLRPTGLYAALHAAFLQRLKERRPGLLERPAAQRNAELARLVGARPEAVARALDAPAHRTGDLVRHTVLLQRLAQKL